MRHDITFNVSPEYAHQLDLTDSINFDFFRKIHSRPVPDKTGDYSLSISRNQLLDSRANRVFFSLWSKFSQLAAQITGLDDSEQIEIIVIKELMHKTRHIEDMKTEYYQKPEYLRNDPQVRVKHSMKMLQYLHSNGIGRNGEIKHIEIQITDPPDGKDFAYCNMNMEKPVITISRSMAEKLTDDELTALLAHEIGHFHLQVYSSKFDFEWAESIVDHEAALRLTLLGISPSCIESILEKVACEKCSIRIEQIRYFCSSEFNKFAEDFEIAEILFNLGYYDEVRKLTPSLFYEHALNPEIFRMWETR